MKTTTSTQVTHYEIQKKRRETLLEQWKGYHKTIQRRGAVKMMDVPSRRTRQGVFASKDGDLPTMNLDAKIHEFTRDINNDPNPQSTWTAFNARLDRKLFKGPKKTEASGMKPK